MPRRVTNGSLDSATAFGGDPVFDLRVGCGEGCGGVVLGFEAVPDLLDLLVSLEAGRARPAGLLARLVGAPLRREDFALGVG
jgi:hypothetical protein